MKKIKLLLSLSLYCTSPLLADSSASLPPNPYDTSGGMVAPAFSQANAQAIYWVNLLDQQQYGATWLEAGGLLRDIITQNQWAAGMQSIRQSLGPVMSRRVVSHSTTKQLPYGTKGNFIILKYDTQYQSFPRAIETVILMTEGPLVQWKVIHYSIKKNG